jgi:hypothetical protein
MISHSEVIEAMLEFIRKAGIVAEVKEGDVEDGAGVALSLIADYYGGMTEKSPIEFLEKRKRETEN